MQKPESDHIDFKQLNSQLLNRAETLCNEWFPNGTRKGAEYVIGGLDGAAGNSMSINLNTGKWIDRATGEKGGDFISLYAAKHDIEQHVSALELSNDAGIATRSAVVRRRPVKKIEPAKPLDLSKYHRGTMRDYMDLQKLRNLPMCAGIEMLADRGLLRFGKMPDRSAMVDVWLLIDEAGNAAQARRMDGKPWDSIGAKAKTLKGSCASWPVGASYIGDAGNVLLVEGCPDMLAGANAYWTPNWSVCAMLGASQTIPGKALDILSSKRVVIFAHHDEAGHKSASKWANQLREVGASVSAIQNQTAGGDLNDMLSDGGELELPE